VPVRCLSIHAGYGCRHSGACCAAGWPIPIEVDQLARLRAATAAGHLRPAARTGSDIFLSPPDAPADAPALIAVADHRCVFFDAEGGRLCRIQHALGHDALPLACRQFPRVSVVDPRGVSVTLSHYCPIAASLLDQADPVTIAIDAPAFPPGAEYVGLDVTSSLPPLLRPDMLMDWESWWEWERLSVELLTQDDDDAAGALARLAHAVERTRSWRPHDGDLIDRVRDAFAAARRAQVLPWEPTAAERDVRIQEVLDAIPPDLRSDRTAHVGTRTSHHAPHTSHLAPRTPDVATRTSHVLAAHAFANWTAHLGQGLRSWMRSVEAPFVLVDSGLDVRTTDLWLRHLAEPRELAATWGSVERGR